MRYPLKEEYEITTHHGDRIWYSLTGHKGIDIACPTGTKVFACMSGKITAGYDLNGGNYIYITNENMISRYFHLSQRYKVTGDYIVEGQITSSSGNSGILTTGSHLHWDLQVDGVFVDPLQYLDKEDWLTNFLKENNMTLPEFLNEMKKEFVTKDQRFKQSKDGRVWIVSDAKKLKYSVEKEIALPMSKLVSGWLSDEQFSYRTVTDQKEVL